MKVRLGKDGHYRFCTELKRCANSMGVGWFTRWYIVSAYGEIVERKEMQYLGYSKKETIAKLRAQGISVSCDCIKYGYEL